ncbi:MAG: hypothetical protein AAFX53_06140 [Bacteroidota bacterium]
MKLLPKAIFLFGLFLLMAHAPDPFPPDRSITEKPEYYILEWPDGTELTERKTGIHFEVDSVGQHDVRLLVNQQNRPTAYTSDISTPVCADGECRLMDIKLYWTLLGEYAGFDTYPGLPLTKHDHDEFQSQDYDKLHRLLLDRRSILERRTIDQLVEKPKMRKVNGVDALSGATIAEVKETVVSGALYSCYVAWHLANGHLQDSMKAHTRTFINDEILLNMLESDNSDYHAFALEKMEETQFISQHLRVAEVFKTGIPMVRGIIIKSLPAVFWETETLQKPFWDALPVVDLNSRSFLLEHLEDAPEAVIEKVSSNLGILSKNQLKIFLDFLSAKDSLSPHLLKNLETFAQSKTAPYGYLAVQFLEDL